ncbi:MAG: hypothetical protein ABJ042_06250, partial [Lentilitoribacter sp.]
MIQDNINKTTHRIFVASLAISTLATLVGFYLFSRFTVDDAFITWRYGQNLVEFGIWGYNPSTLDLTQSYTNPIYAALSIVPAALNIDSVLFFKVLSILLISGYLIGMVRIAANKRVAALLSISLLALPATMIHAFSGLETFAYTVFLGFLFISLTKNNVRSATVLTAALIFIRPEAWTLTALLPLYFFFDTNIKEPNFIDGLKTRAYNFAANKYSSLIPGLLLAIYLFSSTVYFDDPLPNTFYAKSGGNFSPAKFLTFSFFVAPTLFFLNRRNLSFGIFVIAYFSPIVLNYTTSNLQMNYAERFAFQIFFPIAMLLAFTAANQTRVAYVSFSEDFSKVLRIPLSLVYSGALAFFYIPFAISSSGTSTLLAVSNDYSRVLTAHSSLGRMLAEISETYNISAFSLGDAGAAAFQSRLIALDNVGLGSRAVARSGMSFEVLDLYSPDVVVFHSGPLGVRANAHNQGVIQEWVAQNHYLQICDIYLRSEYTLRIFSR